MGNIKNKTPVFLSINETNLLLKNTKNERHRIGISLMSYAGLRISELTSLKVSDINLSKSFIKIVGKGNKERIIPLTPYLQTQLEKYLQRNSTRLVYDGLLVGGCRSAWHRVVKKNSKKILGKGDVHCHTLRHSYATALYEKGVAIEKIAQLLGHNSIETTMIYSHISLESKRKAVNILDQPKNRYKSKLFKFFNRSVEHQVSLNNVEGLVGRDDLVSEINNQISKKRSFVLSGAQGCGKSALLRQIPDAIFLPEYLRKKSLVYILLLSSPGYLADSEESESLKAELSKMKVDDLIDAVKSVGKIIVIDDISDCSKSDKKAIKEISKGPNVVVSASSKIADRKLFDTYVEVKPLKRHYTRHILSDMIHMVDQKQKEYVINDILHSAGDNLKEAEYIARQLQFGKSTEEIVTSERSSNQVSIAPLLLLVLLFFFSYVVKSYTSSMIAFSYAALIVFRFVFYRLIMGKVMRRTA